MLSSSTLGVLIGTFLVITSIPDAASYTKYGRTCQDIGCMRDEVCVMAEDPCSIYQRDNCGRYPTCTKARPGEASCASTVCNQNEYCKTENGVPTCVKQSTSNGFESAGVSVVNGQRVDSNDNHNRNTNAGRNSNPYAGASAPPAPVEPAGGYHQVNSDRNLGYPPYPSNSGSNNGYPSTNQGNRQHDLGYPPYPTQNRMPVPAYPVQNNPLNHGQAYQPAPGYPQQYPGQYPGHQNYPYANYPNQDRIHHNNVYRRNDATSMRSSSFVLACLMSLVLVIGNRS